MHYVFMLFAHVHDDGVTTWHHQENTIKGGSSFLFTIGNAGFELNTSVILSALGNMIILSIYLYNIYDMYIEIQKYTEIS